MPHRALVVFGTRPEAIKTIPVVLALREHPGFDVQVCITAQHRNLLDEVLAVFGVSADHDLDIMEEGQSLTQINTRVLTGLASVLEEVRPDLLLVQGDTTTTFAGALSAFYHGVRVAHVEAGYRTGDLHQPFPEEANRRLVSEIADWHFAVNENCRQHLLREGHDPAAITVTGNTGIDALFRVRDMSDDLVEPTVRGLLASGKRTILMTMHRRENWGSPIESACEAARELLAEREDIQILFAVHPNRVVQASARSVLAGVERAHLLPALEYVTFSKLLAAAELVMSDSGGVHEEALALGKPLLMLREVSEWPEAVEAGQTRLVGTDRRRILGSARAVLAALDAGDPLPRLENPLADGRASVRLVEALASALGAGV